MRVDPAQAAMPLEKARRWLSDVANGEVICREGDAALTGILWLLDSLVARRAVATVPPYDVPAVHELQDRMREAMDADPVLSAAFRPDVELHARSRFCRLMALVATPVPPLACPRCQVGAIWSSDDGMVCTDPEPGSGGGPGCGARWDACGSPE